MSAVNKNFLAAYLKVKSAVERAIKLFWLKPNPVNMLYIEEKHFVKFSMHSCFSKQL